MSKKNLISIKDSGNYNSRSRNSLILIFILSLVFFVVGSASGYVWGALIAGSIFIIQFAKSSRWDRFFINEISIENRQIEIKYKDRNSEEVLTGDIEDFSLKKKLALNSAQTYYLAIYYKDSIKIKQFKIKEWDDQAFDRVIKEFSEEKNI